MKLEERKVAPGSKVAYVCPEHPEGVSDKPGVCPKDGKKLGFRVLSDATRLSEHWACPLHPRETAEGKTKCPACGADMKRYEAEESLAVPESAVVDSGVRKIVFVEKSPGTFHAVEVTLGPKAGDHYPVLKGLAAGDRVATAGAFLLDAEARLNHGAGVMYFGASGHGEHKK